MYKPSLLFDRTAEERKDPFLSWARDDQAFFAAGACHILAEMFRQLHYGEGYKMIFIKPKDNKPGMHVYVTNGVWAFDHNGWTLEEELLRVTKTAYAKRYEGWDFERIVVGDELGSFEAFCHENNHRLPWQFAYLPWERAHAYIKKFPSEPPAASTND